MDSTTVGRRCQRRSIWRRPLAESSKIQDGAFCLRKNKKHLSKVKTLSPSNLLDSDQTVYYRGGENILLSGTTTETRNETTAKNDIVLRHTLKRQRTLSEVREWWRYCWEQIGSNDSNPFGRMQEGGANVARETPTGTCTGEDQIEAKGAPANCTDMNMIRRIPSIRSGKEYQKPRRLTFESRMRLIRSWVPDLEKIRQTGRV